MAEAAPGPARVGQGTGNGLRQCVRSLLALGLDLDATSIAEALWLAAANDAASPGWPPATGPGERPEPAVTGADQAAPERMRPASPAPLPPGSGARPDEDSEAGLEPLVTGRRALVSLARSGPQPLDLSRALRPFKRRWPDGRRLQLDIEETVRSYARTWRLVPRFRPAPERWFEVDIVIDDSPSMTVWGEMISVLSTLLRQLGAFRTIRTWRISVTGPVPLLHNEGGQPAGAGQLRSPGGRRLIILVSDGSAAGWFRPEAWALVRGWAGSTPTALISPLATRLWSRTGLDLPTARVGPGAPGSGNAGLQFAVPPYVLGPGGEAGGGWLPLPTVTLTPHMLGRWARMLMKADPRGCDALLLPPVRHPPEPDAEDAADPVAAGTRLVNAFRRAASPEAARLAVLCAPFSAVSLELLDLLSAELVPEAVAADLAEVIVGGLFRPATAGPDAPGGELLRFRPGVRERLRELLPETDAWRAYNVLIKHVTEGAGADATFAAGVPDPLGDIAIPADLLPFAAASREALEFLDALPAPWRDEPMITVARPPSGPARPAVWGNVPFRGQVFTGRADLLEMVRRRLTNPPGTASPPAPAQDRDPLPVVLQGLGGVGKTATAAEYAYQYGADSIEYDVVWWVQAEQRALVNASLAALAARLGLATAGSGVEDAARAALDALRRGEPFRRWLLIFDRADQPEELSDLLPQGPGHVLITSRNHRWGSVADTIAVDVFDRAESVDYLRKRIDDAALTPDAAGLLAEALGDLPIALAHAGALIAETRIPVSEYASRLDREVTGILAVDKALEYPVSVTATLLIALEQLSERAPQSAELLYHLAFLDGDQVSLDLLGAGSSELGLGPGIPAGPLDLLARYGLTSSIGHGTISVHRLVQALVRRELPDHERDAYRYRVLLMLAAAAPADPADTSQWARYGELYAHARMGSLDLAEPTDAVVRDFAVNLLRYLQLSGELGACRSLARQLLDRWIPDSGEANPHVVRAQAQLAAVLRENGDYPEARRLTDQAYRNARSGLGEQAEVTMELRRALARDLRLSGDFAGALALDDETSGLLRATGGANAQAAGANSDVVLGLILTSRYREARNLLAHSPSGLLSAPAEGSQDGERAAARTRLSWAARLCGEHEAARAAGQEATEYARARFGARHPAAIQAATALAIAVRCLGPPALAAARDLAAEVLGESAAALGERHPDTLAALVCLANCERELGSPGDALRLTEQAKAGYEAAYGADHPFTHGCVGAIGLLHRLGGDPAAARATDERALDGLYRRLTPDHHYSLSVAGNLASDLAALGDHHQARVMGEDALGRSRALLGEDHQVTLGCAVNLAVDLRADNDPDYADRLHSDTMRRYVLALGGDHPDTKAALSGQRIDFDFDPPPL